MWRNANYAGLIIRVRVRVRFRVMNRVRVRVMNRVRVRVMIGF